MLGSDTDVELRLFVEPKQVPPELWPLRGDFLLANRYLLFAEWYSRDGYPECAEYCRDRADAIFDRIEAQL